MSENREILVTKRFSFSAAHKLENKDFSIKQNKEIFGQCFTHHGHNYVLEVSVSGSVNPDTGMVVNFKDIKNIVDNFIIQKFDHRDLNELEEFKGLVPTAENILLIIEEKLHGQGLKIKKLKLWETQDCFAELTVD